MKHFRSITTCLLAGALILFAAGCEDDVVGEDDSLFAEYDVDESGVIEVDEFDATVTDYDTFNTFDLDDDDAVTNAEVAEGFYGTFDENDDGVLTEAEFDAGSGYLGDDFDAAYDDFDADANSELTEDEFVTSFETHGADVYGNWDVDSDAALNEGELDEGFFGLADTDLSGNIDEDEFNEFDTFFGV